MRQIVLDTETTGLDPAAGHRIIELAAIELIDRELTGREFHSYFNPEREIDSESQRVHGISALQLADAPLFADRVADLLAFIADAELIIHNAAFDVGFVNAELRRIDATHAGLETIAKITDSMLLAGRLHPGQRRSLDALCRRYGISLAGRELHGALIDVHLLARVYLAMTGGQATLALAQQTLPATRTQSIQPAVLQLVRVMPSATELEAHERRLQSIKRKAGRVLWEATP